MQGAEFAPVVMHSAPTFELLRRRGYVLPQPGGIDASKEVPIERSDMKKLKGERDV